MLRFFAPLIAPLVGLLFVCALLYAVIAAPSAPAAHLASEEFHLPPKDIHYSFEGPLGKYDNQQLQRGFQVYKEVCSACHSMRLVAFRDLEEIGFSKPEVKALAKGWATETPSVNPDTGEPATRKSLPSDFIPGPYANETAARAANNNALPPDMSLLAKAREGGPAYIASLVTGYADAKTFTKDGKSLMKEFPDFNTPTGLHFNPYFANLNIAMPPPLSADGQVTYADGTKATKLQMATDVSAFLMWAAEPKLENRHRTGLAVLAYLVIATLLAFGAYRNIWHGKKH
ncbi:cytochrome c1 [Sphingomonas sp. CGMCC 1.13654]|uniref:Cytochrome c1 n=1 Tax=Sphingomonas chungangi TaxID=2683589 RepID=A0A838LAY3_9SPHN|nr:cytochrome c1 [Sphingomonas chungangi]MBA2935865.1 cytochrome c1 [Sphingomonas chungangi]MVW54556.1 cytochrome c1 [Sphingomonas chungangi]